MHNPGNNNSRKPKDLSQIRTEIIHDNRTMLVERIILTDEAKKELTVDVEKIDAVIPVLAVGSAQQ